MTDLESLVDSVVVASQVRALTDADREVLSATDDVAGLLHLREVLPSKVSRRAQNVWKVVTFGCGLVFLAFMVLTAPAPPVAGVFLIIITMVVAMYVTIYLRRRTRKRETVLATWRGSIDFHVERLSPPA